MKKVLYCFPGGKTKALTLSYDDGLESDRHLLDIMNKNGIRGTFHLNNRFLQEDSHVTPEGLSELYKGHEIACHTATHPTIARCPLTEVADEILSNRRALEDAVGYPIVGFSYPNRSFTDDIITLIRGLGIRYGREGDTTANFLPPQDFYHWKFTCHHDEHLLDHAQKFVSMDAPAYLRLMSVWGHSWQFDRRNNWNIFEEFCVLTAGRDNIWYCTCLEYVDCMEDLERLRFSADNKFVYNPNARSCFLNVDGDIAEIPSGKTVQL